MEYSVRKVLKKWAKDKVGMSLVILTLFCITGQIGEAAKKAKGGRKPGSGILNAELRAENFENKRKRNGTAPGKVATQLSKTNRKVNGMYKRLETIEKDAAKLNEENTFKEKNTFEKEFIAKKGATITGGDTSITSKNEENMFSVEDGGIRTVSKNQISIIMEDRDSLVGGNSTDIVLEKRTELTGKDSEEIVRGDKKIEINKNKQEIVDGTSTETVKGKKVENYQNSLETKVTGNSTETVTGGNKTTQVDKDHKIINEVKDGAKLEMDKDRNKFTKDVYVGSKDVLENNLKLADKDAIEIGKAADVAGKGKVENRAAERGNNTAIGYANTVEGKHSLATGYYNSVNGEDSTTVGSTNRVAGNFSTVMGTENDIKGNSSTVVGRQNKVVGNSSGAFGDLNIVEGNGSYAFGNDNAVKGDNNFALGNKTKIENVNNSVAIGNGSVVRESNEVSVGAKGNERKITNVADGAVNEHSTDVVNGRQLYHVTQKVSSVAALGAALAAVDFAGAPVGKLGVGAGIGSFVDQQAVAVGVAYAPNEDFKMNAKWAATSGNPRYNSLSLGASYYIDLK